MVKFSFQYFMSMQSKNTCPLSKPVIIWTQSALLTSVHAHVILHFRTLPAAHVSSAVLGPRLQNGHVLGSFAGVGSRADSGPQRGGVLLWPDQTAHQQVALQDLAFQNHLVALINFDRVFGEDLEADACKNADTKKYETCAQCLSR